MKQPDFLSLVPSHDLAEAEWRKWDERVAAERAEEEQRAERERRENLARLLVEGGCPSKDIDAVMSGDLHSTPPLDAARLALSQGLGLLVLSGSVGTGKTTAAAWWVAQEHPRPRYVRVGWPRFVDAGALSRWPRFEEDRMRQLLRAAALVIDELGAEIDDRSGAFRSLVGDVVNARYAAQLPTLITTNMPVKDFRERFGGRMADRIREIGRFVEYKGPSLRGIRALPTRGGSK